MVTCAHCDENVLTAFFSEADVERKNPFCCQGCLTVHHVIHQKGLSAYYDIKSQTGLYKRRSPVELRSGEFKYLDQREFLDDFSYFNPDGKRVMEFYLEGIHCLACLWLIEKMPEFLQTVQSSKLDLERSVVTVILNDGGVFSDVARELNNLGYRPHPLKKNQEAADFKLKEERASLIRIGVAGAAAGNIMIYAVSLYGGAGTEFASLFNNLTVLFAIPVLTYSAFPFYQTAWNALKNRTLSIDIPISIALIVGALMGIYNMIIGVPENYFDSLTALVFLLLLSRYFLHRIQEKGLSASDLHYFYESQTVLVEVDSLQGFKEIHPRFLKAGDKIKVRAGEFIPADGEILSGQSYVNNSLLTGESAPVKVGVGGNVYSGTQNLNQDLVIRAQKVQQETRLGNILKNVENGWALRSKIVTLANLVSKYFTAAVFILAVVLFIKLSLYGSIEHALEQAITLLIVTCPCALALAIPLTFTRSLSKASQQGIIIKNDEVLEKLSKVKNIFLDKTGTLTFGQLKVINFKVLHSLAYPVKDVVYSLENKSQHPTAKALLNFVLPQQPTQLNVVDYQELLGVGVEGRIGEHFFIINRSGLFQDNELVATFEIEDVLRPDSIDALKGIDKQKIDIKVLSGDQKIIVEKIVTEAGLPASSALSELSPEAKAQLIQKTPHSLMVGDGANDAIALGQADVGVAVLGAMDISLRAADVYLTTPGLIPVEKLIILSKETMKVIRRNLVLSILYNSLSVTVAFLGFINPLVAAIIMPVSSLTVLISTLIGTKKMRNLWKS
jgi:heavy metal-(Cd/Co/Hg/Pb/Zn)-translocating P-type ATPase